MAAVVDEIGATCVIADSADTAERIVAKEGRVVADRTAAEACEAWNAYPLPMKSRYRVYSVRLDRPYAGR